MLQNQVARTGDPRLAALAIAATAALLLTVPVPPDVPALTAGLPRAPAVRSVAAAKPGLIAAPEAAPRPASIAGSLQDAGRPRDHEEAIPPVDGLGSTMAGHSRYTTIPGGHGVSRPEAIAFPGSTHAVQAPRAPRTAAGRPVLPSLPAFDLRERTGSRRRVDGPVVGAVFAAKILPAAFRGARVARLTASAAAGRRPGKTARFVHARAARASAEGRAKEGGLEKRSSPRRPRHRPHRSRAARARPAEHRRSGSIRPLLLSKLIGRRRLNPPAAGLEPPPRPERPAQDQQGRPLPAATADLSLLDDIDPARFRRDRNPNPHWDGEVWHRGSERGLAERGAWLPLRLTGGRWWAFAAGGAQLRHDGVWWMKERGVWLVVHEGRPWAWRSFQDWDAEGLFQPGSGTEMVYSKDFTRVAVITPGRGADVYDSATGETLAQLPEERMPPRRRPRRPAVLEARGVDFDR